MTPFYKKALSLFTKTQEQQIKKGLAKYPEPFTPSHWTPEELLKHALEETVDLTHYLVGLKELLDAKDQEIADLKIELKCEKDRATMYAREVLKLTSKKVLIPDLRNLQKKSPFEEQYDMNFNPHFDQDDQ